jgi:glutamine amidotransferase PdxT
MARGLEKAGSVIKLSCAGAIPLAQEKQAGASHGLLEQKISRNTGTEGHPRCGHHSGGGSYSIY